MLEHVLTGEAVTLYCEVRDSVSPAQDRIKAYMKADLRERAEPGKEALFQACLRE